MYRLVSSIGGAMSRRGMQHTAFRCHLPIVNSSRFPIRTFSNDSSSSEENDSYHEDIIDIDDDVEADIINADEMTPKQVVEELGKHIIGQEKGKRAVAIALRNRWRRNRLESPMKEEVMPKNILMIGPTGCGKTEVARRLAKLTQAPFIKVEATKFTEVGFHGRDVDQIIRDLVRIAIMMQKTQHLKKMKSRVELAVENAILDSLIGRESKRRRKAAREMTTDEEPIPSQSRADFLALLRAGELDDQMIDVDVPPKEADVGNGQSQVVAANIMIQTISRIGLGGKRTEKKEMSIKDAIPILRDIESDKLINDTDISKEAIKSVEENGIVFIDEIDKIVSSPSDHKSSADASAEGVQRDLLPLVEGTVINTKHGNVNTEHILFIASGAFSVVKPSDMLAELQGRLPIRVQLNALTEDDLYRILCETEHNLIKQQVALLSTENINLVVEDAAIREIAKVTCEVNRSVENIGARRLNTVLERIMDEISFDAPDMAVNSTFTITPEYVHQKVTDLQLKTDLSKYIL